MTPQELERAARDLYERNTLSAPRWDQLGETTKSVWREEVGRRAAELGSMLE